MDKWKKCLEYCFKAIDAGEADPNMVLLKRLANKEQLDETQRAWLCLLYSTCYCASTAWFLYKTLPPLDELKRTDLNDYWTNVGKKLVFQSDRRYVKNMNWFVPIIVNYRSKVGANHETVLKAIHSKSQDDIFKIITTLKYCGRFTAFLFIDCAQALFDIDVSINPKNWNEWATAGEGLCHAIDREDLVDQHHQSDTYPKEVFPLLDESFEKMKKAIKKKGVSITDSELETALCAYRKLFKQTRYYGYYIDRQQEEFELNRTTFEKSGQLLLLDHLYMARKRYLDNSLLGEINGWAGLRKERYKTFVETGGQLE